ncbi:MAG TPA: hypothetical protein VMU75_07420 [Acidimicrobiales bacterium]|nr:hypothetical protein [Acidimicrobiales bacterium]
MCAEARERSGGFLPLTEDECLERLRTSRAGHLATTVRALPVITPVYLEPIRLERAGALLVVEPVLGAAIRLSPDTVVALAVGCPTEGVGAEWTVLAQGVLTASLTSGAGREQSGSAVGGGPARFHLRCEVLSGWRRLTAQADW